MHCTQCHAHQILGRLIPHALSTPRSAGPLGIAMVGSPLRRSPVSSSRSPARSTASVCPARSPTVVSAPIARAAHQEGLSAASALASPKLHPNRWSRTRQRAPGAPASAPRDTAAPPAGRLGLPPGRPSLSPRRKPQSSPLPLPVSTRGSGRLRSLRSLRRNVTSLPGRVDLQALGDGWISLASVMTGSPALGDFGESGTEPGRW
jgi:hypothetical protein